MLSSEHNRFDGPRASYTTVLTSARIGTGCWLIIWRQKRFSPAGNRRSYFSVRVLERDGICTTITNYFFYLNGRPCCDSRKKVSRTGSCSWVMEVRVRNQSEEGRNDRVKWWCLWLSSDDIWHLHFTSTSALLHCFNLVLMRLDQEWGAYPTWNGDWVLAWWW